MSSSTAIFAVAGKIAAARVAAVADINLMEPRQLAQHHYSVAEKLIGESGHLLHDYEDEASAFSRREMLCVDATLEKIISHLQHVRAILSESPEGGRS